MVLTGLLGRSLRPRVRLPFGLPLVPRRAPRVAELVLCALRFAVEVVGPVVTTNAILAHPEPSWQRRHLRMLWRDAGAMGRSPDRRCWAAVRRRER